MEKVIVVIGALIVCIVFPPIAVVVIPATYFYVNKKN